MKDKSMPRRLAAMCAFTFPAILILSNPASAQTADPDPTVPQAAVSAEASPQESGLDDIVVTAQRREQRLQDTPISITAVTGATLEARGSGTIASLGTVTPNPVYNTAAPVSGVSSGAVVFIRGVGQTDYQLTTDPGVGTYLDGVYVAGRSAAFWMSSMSSALRCREGRRERYSAATRSAARSASSAANRVTSAPSTVC